MQKFMRSRAKNAFYDKAKKATISANCFNAVSLRQKAASEQMTQDRRFQKEYNPGMFIDYRKMLRLLCRL